MPLKKTGSEIMKTIKENNILLSANVIGSHMLYSIEHNDDGSWSLKARTTFHGNSDYMKNELTMNCSTCLLTDLQILDFIASLYGWKVYKLYFYFALL